MSTSTGVRDKNQAATVATGSSAGYAENLSRLIDIKPAQGCVVMVHRTLLAGLPTKAIGQLQKAGVGREVIDNIVRPRTLDHRKKKGEPLSPEESDKLYRVAHLLALAESVFGDHDKAMRWLSKPKQRFSGETPFDMAMTSQGTALVEEMLYGIEHGFFA